MNAVMIAWLLAGAWASWVSHIAMRRLLLAPTNTLGLVGHMHALVSDLQKTVSANNHRDFLCQYCQLLKLAGNWLQRQLQVLLVQLLCGGAIYLAVRGALPSQATDWQPGSYAGDIPFLLGALFGALVETWGGNARQKWRA